MAQSRAHAGAPGKRNPLRETLDLGACSAGAALCSGGVRRTAPAGAKARTKTHRRWPPVAGRLVGMTATRRYSEGAVARWRTGGATAEAKDEADEAVEADEEVAEEEG
jgi:hypothetical protein